MERGFIMILEKENKIKEKINELLKTETKYENVSEKIKNIIFLNTSYDEYINFKKIIYFKNFAITYLYLKQLKELSYNYTSLIGFNDFDYDEKYNDDIFTDITETVLEYGHEMNYSVWSLIKFKNCFIHMYPAIIKNEFKGFYQNEIPINEIWEFEKELILE